MSIEKLKSGSYRIRKMINGKTYSVTVDHMPKKREAEVLIEDAIRASGGIVTKQSYGTFEETYNKYRQAHENVFSVSTLRGYDSIVRNITPKFKMMPVALIDSNKVQEEVNLYALTHSAKSTSSFYSLISCVLKYVKHDIVLDVKIPPRMIVKKYLPSENDVRILLDAVQNTAYEPPILLATYGMRQSEICALTLEDMIEDGHRVRVNKALVKGKHEWVLQDRTKEVASCREFPIDAEIWNRIVNNEHVRKSGKIYNGSPLNITRKIKKVCEQNGLHSFTIHALRHYYASISHALGIPNKYTMLCGGWKSEETLTRIYQDALTDRAEEMQDIFSQHLKKNIKAEI